MSSNKLIDAFLPAFEHKKGKLLVDVIRIGPLLDLYWPPCRDVKYIFSRETEDPCFILVSYTRFVALAAVLGEIRFLATPIWIGAEWIPQDAARVAAIELEPDVHELAIFETLGDAIDFTVSYLSGVPLSEIETPRTKPTPDRYKPRAQ